MKMALKSWLLIALVGAAGLLLLFAWYFAGVSGEVFLVDPGGAVQSAPGATISIYPADANKNVGGYLLSDLSRFKQHTDKTTKLALALAKLEQTQRTSVSEERINVSFELQRALELENQSYCERFGMGRWGYFRAPLATGNSDRTGHFSLRLRPGRYVVFVEGQAGDHHAVWLEELHLVWRSQVRLVEPQCKYEVR